MSAIKGTLELHHPCRAAGNCPAYLGAVMAPFGLRVSTLTSDFHNTDSNQFASPYSSRTYDNGSNKTIYACRAYTSKSHELLPHLLTLPNSRLSNRQQQRTTLSIAPTVSTTILPQSTALPLRLLVRTLNSRPNSRPPPRHVRRGQRRV